MLGNQTSMEADRQQRLLDELKHAMSMTSSDAIQAWGGRIPGTVATVTVRRVQNIGNIAITIGNQVSQEGHGLVAAWRDNRIWEHLASRGKDIKQGTVDGLVQAKEMLERFSNNITSQPKEEGSKLAATLFGFVIGSGGLDGDGGVPDLDFLGGIGAHRSIFTHSIIAGVVLETLLISTVDLARTVNHHLPVDHDPLWEELMDGGEQLLLSLSQGMSAGIAYHMGIDATFDGDGTYKDLPISVSQDVHQIIIATNAVVEGNDAIQRKEASSVNTVRNEVTQHRKYASFKEAAEVSKRESGTKIVRDPEGNGFLVIG